MKHTWCLWTRDGTRYDHGSGAGRCTSWVEKFGGLYDLSHGDTVSVGLTPDRSMSVWVNKTEVSRVFTRLPQLPLWVVLDVWLEQVEVIQPGQNQPYCLSDILFIQTYCLSRPIVYQTIWFFKPYCCGFHYFRFIMS